MCLPESASMKIPQADRATTVAKLEHFVIGCLRLTEILYKTSLYSFIILVTNSVFPSV
jgi:hypothetical protein